jgi:hypothetical protein
MSNITTTLTIASDLKKRAAKYYVEQFNNSNFFVKNIQRKIGKLNASGREYLIPMLLGDPESFGAHREHEAVSSPGASTWDEIAITRKFVDASISLTDQAISASKGNEASWIEARAMEEKGMHRNFMMKFNELWYGWGAAAIARVNGVPGLNTFVVDDDQAAGAGGTFGTKYLRPGMMLSASANLNGYVMERTFHTEVQAVNKTTLTITVQNCRDLTDDDFILWEASKNRMPMGLMALVDDGTYVANYGGKDRTVAGNEWLQSYIVNVGGPIDERDLIDAVDVVDQNIGVIPTTAFTTSKIINDLAQQYVGDRRFMVNATDAAKAGFTGGWSGVSILLGTENRMNFFADRKCPTGNMFCPNLEDFSAFQTEDPHWLTAPGGSVYTRIEGTRDYIATWVYDVEYVNERPMAAIRFYGIT